MLGSFRTFARFSLSRSLREREGWVQELCRQSVGHAVHETVLHHVVIGCRQHRNLHLEQSIYPLNIARQNTGGVSHIHFLGEVHKSCLLWYMVANEAL